MKLRKEFSGILTWAIQGAIDWQKNGIPTTTDLSMHPGRSQEKATDQESGSIVQRTRPHTGGTFRMRKTA
jgi:hypothetical protein